MPKILSLNKTGLAAALLLLAATSAHAVDDCELNGESISPYNGNTTAGKTGLMRCKDRDTGQLVREQELKAGKFVGVVRQYEKGKLKNDYAVNDKGNRQGRFRTLAADGTVLTDETYEDGSTVGLARTKHASGQLRRVSFHATPDGERASAEFTETGKLRGLRCGDKPLLAPLADDARWCGFAGSPTPVELYNDRGTLTARTTWVAGQRVRHETFNSNGNPSYQDELTATSRTERYFTPSGVKKRELLTRIDGKERFREREQDFSDNGTLVRDRRWSGRQALTDTSYYLNGQMRSKSAYSGEGDAARLLVTDYYDSGKVAATGEYDVGRRGRQQPIGVFRQFSETGRLVAESTYDDKGKVNREKAWAEDGTLVRDDAVFEDGSRKAFAR